VPQRDEGREVTLSSVFETLQCSEEEFDIDSLGAPLGK
jgi:hypothetical protein